jgi:formylglycine-generating enzyme required for sulfatase activity
MSAPDVDGARERAPLLGRDLVRIPGGHIALRDEGTRRAWTVRVQPFLLARHLVTRGLRALVEGAPAPAPDDAHLPATDLSWNDAIRLCNALSIQDGFQPCYSALEDRESIDVVCDFTANGYRLPTEAEWEFACRAGSNDARYGELSAIAWCQENADARLHPVGQKLPNAWGLYDVIGNAWEWCWDLYDPQVYRGYRVFRGGGFADLPRACRASCRRKSHPTFHIDDLGFRLARTIAVTP